MSIFNKKEEYDCISNENEQGKSTVKILGGGCAKCKQIEINTKEALKSLSMDINIEHVKDFAEIASYGVMSTPAIVFNGKVICYGKVIKPKEIISLIQKEINQ
ncbi:MAG: thioredoxin family protein [Oscillospiraceae bacterium]